MAVDTCCEGPGRLPRFGVDARGDALVAPWSSVEPLLSCTACAQKGKLSLDVARFYTAEVVLVSGTNRLARAVSRHGRRHVRGPGRSARVCTARRRTKQMCCARCVQMLEYLRSKQVVHR